jgi:hypothetical protein
MQAEETGRKEEQVEKGIWAKTACGNRQYKINFTYLYLFIYEPTSAT